MTRREQLRREEEELTAQIRARMARLKAVQVELLHEETLARRRQAALAGGPRPAGGQA